MSHDPIQEKNELKDQVFNFWNSASCGEIYMKGESYFEKSEAQRRSRYRLEPYIFDFAKFESGADKDILEIGVGMGADHLEWAKSKPKSLTGIDLTPRAIEHTTRRLNALGLKSQLKVGDAENLELPEKSLDIVYSWGVIHHSPNTPKAVNAIFRVLRSGGTAKIMIYHKYSMVGYMLWIRYGLLRANPFIKLKDIYHLYLESPGTKAYTIEEATELFKEFSHVQISIQLVSNILSHALPSP